MSDKKAFMAEYTNFVPVPSRGKIKIVFEAPIENGNHIVSILGMPEPSKSRWFGLNELEQVSASQHALVEGGETPAVENKGQHLQPAQQSEPKPKNYTGAAKALARNPVFWEYLQTNRKVFLHSDIKDISAEIWIEQQCDVTSCADIKDLAPSGFMMSQICADFYKWEELNKQHGG